MSILWEDDVWQVMKVDAELPDGRKKSVTRVKRPDTASLIAFIEDDKILLLREYRPYYGTYIWMLPSGRVDKEVDQLVTAQRELQEETGYRAHDLQYYCETNFSESVISTNYIFIARDLEKDPLPQDEDELMEVHEVTIEEAIGKVLGSEYVHTASAYALLRYQREFM